MEVRLYLKICLVMEKSFYYVPKEADAKSTTSYFLGPTFLSYKMHCPTYDDNISPKFKKLSFAI